MVRLFSALLALSCCSLFVAASDEFADFAVKYVTADDMDSLTKDSSFFVAFVSQKCPHCRRLLEAVPEIRYHLAQGSAAADFLVMDVNDESNRPFTSQFEINGVPTVYYFHKGRKPMLYNEGRDRAAIVAYAEKVANFKVEPLTTVNDLEKFKTENPLGSVVLVLENESEEWLQRAGDMAFLSVSQPIAFVVRGSEAADGLNDQLYVFFGDRTTSMPLSEFEKLVDEKPTGASYAKFIKRAVLPAVSSFPSQAQSIFDVEMPSILFYVSSGAGIEEAREFLAKLGEEHRANLVVATIVREEEGVSHALEFFGLSADDKDAASVRIFNTESSKIFVYKADGEITLESLSQWVQEYLAGGVSAHVKSQELPENWNKKPLKTLVATNFDEVAFDKSKNVFVKFYAPWCGHCKKIAPDWESLAEQFEDNDKVLIAEVDATANDVDDKFKPIQGYPTIRLYKADTNEVVEYEGERNLDGFVKFVEEQTKEEEEAATATESTSKDEL